MMTWKSKKRRGEKKIGQLWVQGENLKLLQ